MNNNLKEEVKRLRRELHKIPETGFKEDKTSKFIKEYLIDLGYSIEEVAKTGVIAVKKGRSGRSIAFRSDMDALMVEEKTGIEFISTHQGKMHACGHDGHMAILLGFANYLSKIDNLEDNIVLIFQPAEEGPGGAKVIVKEGILEKYNIEAIFGLHIFPSVEQGKIGICSGPFMAQSGEFDIKINAKSSHGAMPQLGIDGIYIASQIIQAYQSIISRNIEPIEGAVITIGKIHGGEARNIIAGRVELEGTIRAFNTNVYNTIKARMEKLNEGISTMYSVDIDMEVRDFYPPVINDNNLYNLVREVLSDEVIDIKPVMLAEDFSYYQEVIPGFFMMLGARNYLEGFIHPLHSCYFNFDEAILMQGIEAYIKICKSYNIFN